jgi:polysaccharide biosynthesis protein PslG
VPAMGKERALRAGWRRTAFWVVGRASARLGRAAVVVALVLAAGLVAVAPASAAPPRTLFGVTWDRAATTLSPADQAAMFRVMGGGGVGAVRTVFSWARAQPTAGGPTDFAATDALVADAAVAGIDLLPIVMYAPRWARLRPGAAASPPARAGPYAAYLGRLVERYGRGGSFWAAHPELPARPIRAWQIWNEPHLRYQWDLGRRGGAWQRGYTALLKSAHRTIKRHDRAAKVVLAGLTNVSWRELARLYDTGARRYFDVGAIHAYTGSVRNVIRIVKLFRTVMRRHHDAAKPVWLTEVSWPAARGHLNPGAGFRSVITTDEGMALRLTDLYRTVLRLRLVLNLQRVYWYTWATSYEGRSESFDYAGLGMLRGDVFTAKPALEAFSAVSHIGR